MHRLRSLLPSANYLFVFEAAARRQSFTAAAEELNISQPAVSKTIRMLESATGLKLFHRDHKRLELTAEGARLYKETQGSFDHLYMVLHSLRGGLSRDTVTVSFSAPFVQLWLMPRLLDFKTRHPDVPLRIELSQRDDHDLVGENIDVSARLGKGNWPGLDARLFAPEVILPVCSPAYLAQHGPILTVGDLTTQALLHFEERYRPRIGWHELFARNGIKHTGPKHAVFTDALSSIQAAVLGQGVALGWQHLVQDYLEAGLLVVAFDIRHRTDESIYIVTPSTRLAKPGAELFRNWLVEQQASEIFPTVDVF